MAWAVVRRRNAPKVDEGGELKCQITKPDPRKELRRGFLIEMNAILQDKT